MEKEQQMEEKQRAKGGAASEPVNSGLKRRSTTIGHRSGHRGPLVLKASPSGINTQVGLGCMATPVSSVAPEPTHASLPAQVTRSIGDWDAVRPRTLNLPTPTPRELRAPATTVAAKPQLEPEPSPGRNSNLLARESQLQLWPQARSCIPEPELRHFTIARGARTSA